MRVGYTLLWLTAACATLGAQERHADLSGGWVAVITSFDHSDYQRIALTQDGGKLTGSSGQVMLSGTVRDGKVDLRLENQQGLIESFSLREVGGELVGEGTRRNESVQFRAYREKPKPAEPQTHVFEPEHFPRFFSSSIAPVLHVYPGDKIKTWTVDADGWDAAGARHSLGGNPQTGPFYIEGALPGDTLVVRLLKVRLNRDTAISAGRINPKALEPSHLSRLKYPEQYNSDWLLDREKGVARLAHPTEELSDYTVPLRPMLGCIGVAPPLKMAYFSGFLGSFGGNMDYNRMREGVTLYLPVFEPGALLFVGDGHAAQGDGELTGNALETSMDIEFAVDVIRGRSPGGVRAEDNDDWMAMGVAGSLNEALQQATSNMARWLEQDYQLNPSQVASVLGTAMRYDIAEVVDPYYNIVARVSKQALSTLRRKN
jgi:amidase